MFIKKEVNANDKNLWVKRSYFNNKGNLISEEEREFDENGNIKKESLQSIDNVPKSSYTEFETDENGRKCKGEIFSYDGSPSGTLISYEYDDFNRISKMTWSGKETDQIVYYEYDEFDNITNKKITSGNNEIILEQQITNTYENNFLIKSTTVFHDYQDNNEYGCSNKNTFTQITEYEYDLDGKLVKELLFDQNGNSIGFYELEY